MYTSYRYAVELQLEKYLISKFSFCFGALKL